MIKALLKKQLNELFSMLFYDRKRNRRVVGGKAVLYIILYILLFVMVIGYSSLMAVGLGFNYLVVTSEFAWAYYGMGAIAAMTIAIIEVILPFLIAFILAMVAAWFFFWYLAHH